MNAVKWLAPTHTATKWLTLILIAHLTLSHLIAGTDAIFRILVSVLPLIILLPGLWRGNRRSAFMLCTLLLLYFLGLGGAAVTPGHLIADLTGLALVVVLFCAAALFMQGKIQQSKLAANGQDNEASPS